MDKKIITIGFAGLLVTVFIAGLITYNSLDNRITTITGQTAEILKFDIKMQKTQLDALAAELRLKADIALYTKYDGYFDTLNKNISDVRDRLARIEGQLSIKHQ